MVKILRLLSDLENCTSVTVILRLRDLVLRWKSHRRDKLAGEVSVTIVYRDIVGMRCMSPNVFLMQLIMGNVQLEFFCLAILVG